MKKRLKWFLFKVRWLRWFMLDGGWPMDTLYHGRYKLDKDSRDIIIDRTMQEWFAREPSFPGHRRFEDKKETEDGN